MKKSKIIGISVIVIVVLAILIFAILIGKTTVSDLKQEELIKQELNEINEMSDIEKMDKEAFFNKINTIVTTGDYAIVEKSVKTYLSDAFNDIIKLTELIGDEKLADILTVNNLKNDGPDFVSTKEYLANHKNEIEKYKNNIYEYLKEEKVMSYINDKGLDSYYVEFYKKIAIEDGEQISQQDKNEIEESINLIYNIIDVKNETIDFLIKNKGRWQVQGEGIAFETQELSEQYTNLINKLN